MAIAYDGGMSAEKPDEPEKPEVATKVEMIKLRTKKGPAYVAGYPLTEHFSGAIGLLGIRLIHLPSQTGFCNAPDYDQALVVAQALEAAADWSYTDPKSSAAVAVQAIGVPVVHALAEKWTDGTQPFLIYEEE